MSPEELIRCAATLRELATVSANFFDKQAPRFAALAEVRRQANRLIETLKGAVRASRGQAADGQMDRHKQAEAPTVQERTTPNAEPNVCYSCNRVVADRHSHYRWMCQACGESNQQKREQQADLTGRVALVTGGRVKIGLQTSLKLLRAGASVHVVTRFPYDAVDRYRREPDWDSWHTRLTIHGLDLRDLSRLREFTSVLAQGPLDILINNAAQTVRPTPEFFEHMDRREESLSRRLSPSILRQLQSMDTLSLPPVIAPHGEETEAAGSFLDRRAWNSWMSRIDEIAPVEAVEVHVINALAPFLLIQGLLDALRNSPWPRRFIINVAAREGQFAGKPILRHPHTNMAKAALNMLTRSLAGELRPQGIFINSVDPGWVSDQRPFPLAERARDETGDWLPLDEVDGAARVLDLVFLAVSTADPPPSGRLWRNYQPCDW